MIPMGDISPRKYFPWFERPERRDRNENHFVGPKKLFDNFYLIMLKKFADIFEVANNGIWHLVKKLVSNQPSTPEMTWMENSTNSSQSSD
jgi:hypothetical protein